MTGAATRFDVGQSLDHGVWSGKQKLAIFLAAFAIVLDGFDGQLMGLAIPTLMKEWGVTRADFAPILAIGLFGMAIGSIFGGRIADRLGRRPCAVLAVFVFGAATVGIAFAHDLYTIGVLRFIAGLGLGGAMPVASTIAAESTPTRHRTVAITLTIASIPLGGMLAGVFASYVLPILGWRAMFAIGGGLPVLLAFVLFFALPETPRWLVRRPSRWGELRTLLRGMKRDVPQDAQFVDVAEQRVEHSGGLAGLFQDGRTSSTLVLWPIFFLSMLATYTTYSWLPTMLTTEGLSVSAASGGLTAYNFGAVFGAIIFASAIAKFGSRLPQLLCAAGAAASALMLIGVPLVEQPWLLAIGLGINGLFSGALQTTLYAVAAHVYPTNIRATGTSVALLFGRIGSILSAFVGAAVITAGGANSYFGTLGLAMIGTFIALALLKRHIPRPSAASAQAQPLNA